MAIINCPECGKTVSDKAAACPNCGCPIENLSPGGIVKIKMSALQVGLNGDQKVTLFKGSSSGEVLWTGHVGEVANLHFDGATSVTIKYHLSLMHYGGECSGVIDPQKSKKYSVQARQGFMSTKLVLQQVDYIDAD